MDVLEKIFSWVDENKDEAVDFLAQMVKIPSINPWFSNYQQDENELEVQKFIANYLERIGFFTQLWDVDEEALGAYDGMPGYYKGRPMKNRPNLWAVLKGSGGGQSMLLTGHADVVKVGDGWTKEPFAATIEDGKMYGRGTVDMKGGIAAMIMAVEAIRESGVELRGDVIVGTVPDEEAGGMGTLSMVHHKDYVVADGAIMTEPTGLTIGPICRGILWGKIVIPARAGHIEMAQGHWADGGAVDAVRLVQLLLAHIDHLNRDWAGRKRHPLLPMPNQMIVAEIHAGEYPSAYAGSAEISFNAQYFPSELDEKFRGSKVKTEIEDFIAAVAETDSWMQENPPYIEWILDADCAETEFDSPFVQTMHQAALKAEIGDVPITGVTSHSDMGWYVRSGVPTINFGPGEPRIAHQPDEHIEIDEYIKCVKMIAAMILEWCG